MLDSSFFSVIVGLILGILAGLGVGGGSLLILWLTLVLHMDPIVAKNINLLFFIPTALTASLFRWRNQNIPWKIILPAALAGCLSAVAGAWLSFQLNTSLLRKLFGILMLCTAFRELTYKPKTTRTNDSAK